MLKLIFRFFLELIFARQEEYDFKSKHFKPSKVIFTGIVFLSFILNFFLISGMFRLGVEYVDLHGVCKNMSPTTSNGIDKNQSEGPSDNQKPPMENKDE